MIPRRGIRRRVHRDERVYHPAETQRAIGATVYEYLLITVPVALFVLMEAVKKEEPEFFVNSPEWSIATIFLAFQGTSLYRGELQRTGQRTSDVFLRLLELFSLLIFIGASINAYLGLGGEPEHSAPFRLVLFFAVSIEFFLLVGGAKLQHYLARIPNDGQ